MLNNNFKTGLGIILDGGVSSTIGNPRTITDVNGAVRNNVVASGSKSNLKNYLFFEQMHNAVFSGQFNTYGTFFGSGTGTASTEDYKLSGELITGMAATCVVKVEETDTGFVKTAVFTITNNNNEDKTIGEIGMSCAFLTPNGNSTSTYWALVDHTYLENPVAIPANGGVGQVTYTVTVNM